MRRTKPLGKATIIVLGASRGTMNSLMARDDIGRMLLVLAFGEQWEKQLVPFGKNIVASGNN